jgi:hypothetical protein
MFEIKAFESVRNEAYIKYAAVTADSYNADIEHSTEPPWMEK